MLRPKLDVLSQEEVKSIIEAAYDYLENYGVKVENEEVLRLLADAGAKVDLPGEVAYITSQMIDNALASVPSSFSVFDLNEENPAILADDNIYFCEGSVALNLFDSENEIMRKPKIHDLIDITRLGETLEHVAFQTGPILPDDIPEPVQDAYRFYHILMNSTKPIFGGAFTIEGLRAQKEMLAILRGGEAALAAKPRAIFAANPTSPLMWGKIIVQNMIDSARSGIPVMLIPMPLPGGNAPVTLAGTLTEHTAENLSGIVIMQTVNPRCPVLYGGGAITLDMRSGNNCIGAVETMLLGCGYSQIGKALGMPTASNIGEADSPRVDSQSGIETGMGAMFAALAGVNLSRGVGMMGFANCQSLEKMVIDNNICGMALRFIRGITCNEETIALDLLKSSKRMAKGHLTSPHTMKWFKKELFFPTAVINRRAAREGVQAPRAFERAKLEVRERLAKHETAKIPGDKAKELKSLIMSYAKSRGVDQLPHLL